MNAPPHDHRRGGRFEKFLTAASFSLGIGIGAVIGHSTRQSTRQKSSAKLNTSDVSSRLQLLQSLRTGVCVVNGDDHITHANDGATTLGIIKDGALSDDRLIALAGRVRSIGEAQDTDMEFPTEGEPAAARVHASPLPGGHVTIELIDVSELHRVERMRRDFVANVSHELKTPVGAMQLLSEALTDAVDDPQAAARFIARIQHESTRMARLVSELLELSRLQGAEPMPQLEAVSADRVISEAFDRGRTAATAKDISLLRTGTKGQKILGAESQLTTAIGNLVGNAIAYSPSGTTVTVDTTAVQGWIQIRIIDQGIGIEAEDRERIFERFYRADPARSRATGGTGLGLAIVKHIVSNHGGKIEVSSMPGNGTTFTLMLPSITAKSDQTAPALAGIKPTNSRTHQVRRTKGQP